MPEILEYQICLVPEGAEYINPYPDAIEMSKMGMDAAISYEKDKTVLQEGNPPVEMVIDEINMAILPEGWAVLQEGEVLQAIISICPKNYQCACGRGAQRDDVLKWWWYLDRNVFDFLGLNLRIKKTRKLTRAQVFSTESGLLWDMKFASIPLLPGED